MKTKSMEMKYTCVYLNKINETLIAVNIYFTDDRTPRESRAYVKIIKCKTRN